MNYFNFSLFEQHYHICDLFNQVMTTMQPFRRACVPLSFDEKDASKDELFCDFCRYETWMHESVMRLLEWINITNEYFEDFGGSWKYYAASKRISCLRETGEEESVIFKEGLKDTELAPFSVVSDLYDECVEDIVQDTVPEDLKKFCCDYISFAGVDIFGALRKHIGANIIPYRMGKDGEMEKMTVDDCNLEIISRKVDAEDNVKRIKGVCGGIHGVIHIIKSCEYNLDNRERLEMVRSAASSLLNLDFKKLGDIIKDFRERYPQYDK